MLCFMVQLERSRDAACMKNISSSEDVLNVFSVSDGDSDVTGCTDHSESFYVTSRGKTGRLRAQTHLSADR